MLPSTLLCVLEREVERLAAVDDDDDDDDDDGRGMAIDRRAEDGLRALPDDVGAIIGCAAGEVDRSERPSARWRPADPLREPTAAAAAADEGGMTSGVVPGTMGGGAISNSGILVRDWNAGGGGTGSRRKTFRNERTRSASEAIAVGAVDDDDDDDDDDKAAEPDTPAVDLELDIRVDDRRPGLEGRERAALAALCGARSVFCG